MLEDIIKENNEVMKLKLIRYEISQICNIIYKIERKKKLNNEDIQILEIIRDTLEETMLKKRLEIFNKNKEML